MQFQFDTAGIEAMQPFGALPPGRYDFVIVETEIKNAKSGQGQYLQITSDVVSGPLAGRKLFDRFNIAHASEQAEKIGRGQLAAMLAACGVARIQSDTSELHGHRFTADVKIDRNPETNAESNKVTAYLPFGGAGMGQQSAPPPAQQPRPAFTPPAAAAQQQRAPWQK